MSAAGHLQRALEALDPDARSALLWRVRDGLPLPEVAARLERGPDEAGRLLVAATRRLAPLYGAEPGDYRWLPGCRAQLRALPAVATAVPEAGPRGRWLAIAGVATMAAGVALLAWSLWSTHSSSSAGADAPQRAAGAQRPGMRGAGPAPALPFEDPEAPPLAAADLPLLAASGDDHALLDAFELLAWIAEQHLPADATAPAPPPLPPAALLRAPAPDWLQLSPEQRALLASWEGHWLRIGAEQRRQLAANAQLWGALTPEQQGQLRARLQQWRALAPAERARLRLRHERFERLGAADQARLRAALRHLHTLPAIAAQQLRAQFAALPAARREGYLLAGAEREVAALAQRVFAYVPSAERTDTLAMLEELGTEERALLERLSARMAPWQRDQLRQDLLARAPRERADYLRSLPPR